MAYVVRRRHQPYAHIMFRNYFKIAFRSLLKSKVHSFINVAGLTLGITCCILISLFVYDEWTFDTFHEKSDRIYRAYVKENWGENQEFFNTVTPFPLGPALKENFEEVESMIRITSVGTLIKVGQDTYRQRISVTGQDFFTMFDFQFLAGDRETALTGINNIVLTELLAVRYFGEENPVGKNILIQLGEEYEVFEVRGVVANPPSNSSIVFSAIISDLNFPRLYNERQLTSGWFNITPETYVLLRTGMDVKQLEKKFPDVLRTSIGEDNFKKSNFQAGLQPLTTIHLDTSFPVGIAPISNPRYSYILSAIAVLLLVVACINFISLSIGRSLQRAKEVGIRKVSGALRSQLIVQFIGEALILTCISLVLGITCSQLALPLFNTLSGKLLQFEINEFLVIVSLLLVLTIGVLAGSYPALILSGLKPTAILKGTFQGISSRQGLRKVLVGIQLMLSIFLISCTLIMSNQLNYLQHKNLGYQKEQLIVVPLMVSRSGNFSERIQAGFSQGEILKSAFTQLADVAGVCTSSHDFGTGAWGEIGYTDDQNIYRNFYMNIIEPDYLNVLQIALKAGRNFDANNPSDSRMGVIINESFAKSLGWEDPIGKKIPGKGFPDHEIIGLVNDFHFSSLYSSIAPLAMAMNPDVLLQGSENINFDSSPYPKLIVKLLPGNMSKTIDQLKTVWQKVSGEEEFIFNFVDESLAQQYRADQNLGKIIRYATIIAIIIGSMGLYGLASLAMENRRKEISIRKILGATEKNLMVMLSRDYILLVLGALLISIPITWFFMRDWLSAFEYRVTINADVFLISGGISIIVALTTIAYQTIKTALEKPADNLKCE